MPNPVEVMWTGINALDEMLGGRGIPYGSTVLIRGGPGTGKTTLALQIVRQHLKTEGHVAAFVSLEKEPAKVIEYANAAFNFGIDIPERASGQTGKASIILVGRRRLQVQ